MNNPRPGELSPLGVRLVAATVAFSTLVALLATAFQLYLDYKRDLGEIETTFDQVDQSYLPTIANALWGTDRQELQVAINGLARLRDVRYVQVTEGGTVWAQAGQPKTGEIQVREYALTHLHKGESVTVGRLQVVVDMAGIYRRLLDKFWVILLTNSVKTFLVAGFMLWLFHWWVTRHLRRVAEFASRLNADNLDAQMVLDRPGQKSGEPDEFDVVRDGFSRMQANLAASMNALRESEARFRVVFEQAAVGVAQIQSDNGRFVRVNQKFCAIVGFSQAELQALDSMIITHMDDLPAELSKMSAIKAGTIGDFSLEKRYYRKDGSVVWVALTVSPMWLPNQSPDFHIAVVQDISARKQAEARLDELHADLEHRVAQRTAELEASNRELEAFSYSVSHDLRAPLRGIDGFSQALIEDYGDRLDSVAHDYLQRVRLAAQRMGVMIDAMLRLARLTRSTMHFVNVNLSVLADEVVADIKRNLNGRAIDFFIQPAVIVYGDSELLRNVIENLMDNAFKYSSKVAHAKIEFGCRSDAGRLVYFVRDNGAGFDMAHKNKLFGTFQRLHRDDEFAGTGVGLATVRRIVRRHGGDIWAESGVNEGSTFYFSLGVPAANEKDSAHGT